MWSQTHTHMQTHRKKIKLHKPQEPNIAVAHISTGLWLLKIEVLCKVKKKSVKEFSCYLLYRFFWDDFMDFWIWKKLMLRQLSNACTCRSIYWTSTTSTATSGCRAMYRNCVKIKHKIKCWVSIIQQEKAILIDPLSDLRLLELITKIFVMFQYNTTMLFYIVNNI